MNRFENYLPWVIFGVSLLLFSWGSWDSMIYILDEAKNAQCAREMWQSGEWIIPTFNGEWRFDKPPFHYYVMRLFYEFLGFSPFSARFGSAVFGACTVVITFLSAKRQLGLKIATLSSFILLSSIHFTLQHHLAVPDPYLIALMTACLFSFYFGHTYKKMLFIYGFYVMSAFAVIAKGPIGIALPGLIALIYLLLQRDNIWKTLLLFRPHIGIILFLLIALPWYYLVTEATDGVWLERFLSDHNLSRFASTKEGHGGFFFVTPIMILLGMLPFSILITSAAKSVWKVRKDNSFIVFSAVVVSVITIFFSISSTKLPNYPVPLYPFFAIILSWTCFQIERIQNSEWAILAIISLAIPVGAYFGLNDIDIFKGIANVSIWLLVIPIATFIAFVVNKNSKWKGISIFGFGYILGSLVLFTYIYPQIDSQNPVAQSRSVIDARTPAISYRYLNPAFVVEFNKSIEVTEDVNRIEEYLKVHPDAIVITRKKYVDELSRIDYLEVIFQHKDLFENPHSAILQRN